ncbi:MAG: hypothetical protein Q8N53_00450 [Longimicrobiales bacterium]|nr:hypothetical protein [Longimicrobiales bacterium]
MAGQGPVAFRDYRELTALFDRERFGLNVSVGVTYFVGQMVVAFTWMVPPLLQGGGIGWNPPAYYAALVVSNALEAAAFVVVVHQARDVRSLLLAWGGASVVLGVAFRGVLKLLAFEGWSMDPLLDPVALTSSFAYGALFLYGTVLAVRRWATVPWSFMAGAAGGVALHAVAFRAAWALRESGFGVSWLPPAIIGGAISGAINGVILGGLFYAGVARHLKGASVAVQPPGPSMRGAPATAPAVPLLAPATSTPGARQHYFVCSNNPSLIKGFMDVYAVAATAGCGEFRQLRASVFGPTFEAARRGDTGGSASFPGKEFMGQQSWPTTSLEQVLRQMQASESSGSLHVAYGATTSAHADWMQQVYQQLIGDALKQGILPFQMYVTESEEAAKTLLAALEAA